MVPYSTSGNAWPHPELITLSFEPDGTNLGYPSNLFATFNAKFGSAATWENQILKAAQLWAQQTNINFSVISDSGADAGSGNYQQGNPAFGDIRIGGFNFGSSTLAVAYMPPPVNNYSIAGDIAFNTGQTFNIGSTFDLMTVAAHEIGHALGLYHSAVTSAVMYPTYQTRYTALSSDDIAGIQNIYSSNNARSYDSYNNTIGSFSAAANSTGLIDGNSTVLKTGLDITTTSEKEYFTITAPSTTTGTMTVVVQSSGLSMLAPNLTVYNSSQTQIGYASGVGHYGTTVTVNITGVSAGQQFYVKVGGADTTAFGTGAYALTFAFAGIAPPAVPVPNTQVLNGSPIMGGGGMAEQAGDPAGRDTARDTFGPTDDAPPPSQASTSNPPFVAQAYDFLFQKVLNRPADSSGLDSFSHALNNGTTPLLVAAAIVSSQEADANLVNDLYTQFLKRSADNAGLDSFAQLLRNGAAVEAVVVGIVGSDEYFGLTQSTSSS